MLVHQLINLLQKMGPLSDVVIPGLDHSFNRIHHISMQQAELFRDGDLTEFDGELTEDSSILTEVCLLY